MTGRKFSTLAILFFAASLTWACGEPAHHLSYVDDSSTHVGGGGGGGGSGGAGTYHLEALDGTNFESNLGGSINVGVRLTDRTGTPADNELIEFEFIESTGGEGIQFDAPNVFTDDQGRAINRVRVGDLPGNLVVRARHEQASQTVDFSIEVTTIPAGDLRIAVEHHEQDLLEIQEVDLHIWESWRTECSFIGAYALPNEPFLESAHLPSIDDRSTFEGLQTNDTYTVTATGYGPQGQISAHGCIDGVEIVPDGLTDEVIEIFLQPLNAMGAYEVISHWDFREALAASGPVGAAIAEAFEWIADPGQAAADYIVGLIVDWICDTYGTISWECGAAMTAEWEGSAQDMIASFINDQIDNIGILSDFHDMATDLMNTVADLTVESRLTIENKLVGEGEVSGTDTWRAIYVYWTRNCDANDPPDCGEIRIGLGDSTEFGLLEADWDGEIHSYDKLSINPHEMILPYGKIITHVMRQYLIPWLTGGEANSLSGAFEYLLCDNIGGFSAWGVSIDASTIQGFCSTAFGAVGVLAEIYIHNLQYDVGLDVMGEGLLIDLESNSRVDVIEDGFFFGELEGEDGNTTELEAEFTAERIN